MLAHESPCSKPEKLSSQVEGFDYTALDRDTRVFIQERARDIKERLRNAARTAWEIGQDLVEVRDRLNYGQFKSWLQAEFRWSRSTAYNYINIFESFGSCPNFGQLNIDLSALYLLAAPSTPSEARQEVLNLATTGKDITHSKVKAIVKEYRETKPKQSKPVIVSPARTITKSSTSVKPELKVPTQPSPTPSTTFAAVDANRASDIAFENNVSDAERKPEKVTPTLLIPTREEEVGSLAQSVEAQVADAQHSESNSDETETESNWRYGNICQYQGALGKVVLVAGDDIWVDFDGRTRNLSISDIELPGLIEEDNSADSSREELPKEEVLWALVPPKVSQKPEAVVETESFVKQEEDADGDAQLETERRGNEAEPISSADPSNYVSQSGNVSGDDFSLQYIPSSKEEEKDCFWVCGINDIYSIFLRYVQHLDYEQVVGVWQAIAPRVPAKSLSFCNWETKELEEFLEKARWELQQRQQESLLKSQLSAVKPQT